ncbi:hypothetical protein GCM10011380_05590 [Sphingomonas metalli]|uniref:SGNH hydrolase-type esterase domain-containing protein n=1 Tax=Sphingomonas metalli TaxID=1779358 RepID=A0A916WQ13_9SPHN|nr:SGNH/GDSL hydrolase family protein [Sphingomonas metalli]GGB18914.1 hypothetical protein GCM10011380_05590 [Sphingomonas metalli]
MLILAEDLSSFTLAAGEPFILDLVPFAADGTREPLAKRGFVLSFHDDERQVVTAIDGVATSAADGTLVRFARDGTLSEALYGQSLTVELAERLPTGRDVIAAGRLVVVTSAEGVAPLADSATSVWATHLAVRTDATGRRSFAVSQAPSTGVPPAIAKPTVSLSAALSLPEGDSGTRAFTYTVTRSASSGAVGVAWTFAAGQTSADDFAGSSYPKGGTVALADGAASGSFTVEVAGDTQYEPDESFTVAIVPPPGYAGGSAVSATGTILNDDPAPLPGFAANGATNAALRAAVARVRAGTGRGRIVWKGDSVTVGQGAGTSADPHYLTGARAKRIPAVLATLLSQGGTRTLDGAVVADHAIAKLTGLSVAAYDPRIVFPADGWRVIDAPALAGGGFWAPHSSGWQFTPEGNVDSFEVVVYQSNDETYGFAIDGKPPAGGAATLVTKADSGFVRHVLKAADSGSHTLTITGAQGHGALRSVAAYAAGAAALDMSVHAALGARTAQQAATGSGWSNREALVFDAPDLTIVMLGLNDMAAAVAATDYATGLASIVEAAKASGDVLLVFPPPAAGDYNRNVVAMRDAAAGVAAKAGIAFFSLYDYYGPFSSTLAARMADGEVHPRAEFAAEIAGLLRDALRRMAPGIG